MLSLNKRSSLLTVLICLTLLSIAAQLVFFAIHNHVSELVDDLVGSSLSSSIFHLSIVVPLLEFILIQIIGYLLFIGLIWFISVSCAVVFKKSAYILGVIFWLSASLAIFTLNAYYFPDSFFANGLLDFPYLNIVLILSLGLLIFGLAVSYYHLYSLHFKIRNRHCEERSLRRGHLEFIPGSPRLNASQSRDDNFAFSDVMAIYQQKRRGFVGLLFLGILGVNILVAGFNFYTSQIKQGLSLATTKPNIIIIGIDSLRPDYLGLRGLHPVKTPQIDSIIKAGVYFTNTYTPLARTFPAWVSILTGKYPKNSHARINLGYAKPVLENDTLAKQLKLAGYATLYATDEKRFSNITPEYGFDQIVGPQMGLNDFILGGLSDFPLTNLLINLPLGRYLFPYNYANRAANITYEPDNFLKLLEVSLHQRSSQPLFLAIHFCVTHWPFTWAQDKALHKLPMNERYQGSIEIADQQLAGLLQILQKSGLLDNTLVVLLSDHGTSFGLLGDKMIDQAHYQGDPLRMKWVPMNQLSKSALSSIDLKANYSINTAYGQGTDVLSMKQYQVLLAFKYFGQHSSLPAHRDASPSALIDIAPTILHYLHLQPMKKMDGISLLPRLQKSIPPELNQTRPLFLESGYSVSEIETNQIDSEKVVKTSIHLYQVNPENGYLYIKPTANRAVLERKQRAVLRGNWILARYPEREQNFLLASHNKLVFKSKTMPAYYVLVNVKTGKWSVGLDSALAKSAPLKDLHQALLKFYGDEI